jgi:anti-sigma regulatory factor (Ser/Thr protein kinase)
MRLGIDLQNVGVARRFVQTTLDGVVPHAVTADLVLATSELVTNAIEHGRSASVLITARHDGSRASVSIRSGGDTNRLADVAEWRTAAPDRVTGRGLGIVNAIADDVEVVRTGDEVEITVWKRYVSNGHSGRSVT